MKTILVYTFSSTLDNYGQVLQYLATQNYLDSLGYESYLLKEESSCQVENTSRVESRDIKSITKLLYGKTKRLFLMRFHNKNDIVNELWVRKCIFNEGENITKKEESTHPRFFDDFRTKFFRIRKYSNIQKNPPSADAYIVGSDQTWSWIGDENFLDFGSDQVKRIAISPSFGSYVPRHKHEKELLQKKLSRFDLVTVREKSGVNLCKKYGRLDAFLMMDPTLFLSHKEYEQYESHLEIKIKPYIFIYLLGNPTHINLRQIYRFARKEGLEVIYVASQGRRDHYSKIAATVPQWLSLIKGAKYVFTNSYHGVCLSLVYQKKFIVFPLEWPMQSMNDRLYTLLSVHGLSDRLFSGNIIDVKNDIDYSKSIQYRFFMKEKMSQKIKEVIE